MEFSYEEQQMYDLDYLQPPEPCDCYGCQNEEDCYYE
jgi:hypothetical protein